MKLLTIQTVHNLLERHGHALRGMELRIQPGIGAEGFRIDDAGITGNDERGLIYGVGKYLRDPAWRGTSVPAKPVRGMYFASHFHNFYHDAPVAEVCRYVEELALWGCNALTVWFDMHHYTGLDDSAARAMTDRLRAILRAASGVGMSPGLLVLANEAYANSPVELRAEPFPHHYRVELCPSKPGGLDLLLKWRREMFLAFADLPIEHVWIWPHDQGGCKCTACAPWGGNGFVRNSAAVGRLAREIFPRAKTIISTWEFGYWQGEAEWDQFYAALQQRPDWADYVMAEHHGDYPKYVLDHGAPGGLPLLNFPEISMSGMCPWGGFGANLQPQRLQKVWNTCAHLLAGGFPYSEGIFEDLNKVVCLQLNWNPARPVADIVREYAAGCFDAAVADDVTRAVFLLEDHMYHTVNTDNGLRYGVANVRDAETPFALLDNAARRLAPAAASAWRWRMLWIRAALDRELKQSAGASTDQADAWFEELSAISHADHAEWLVHVPSRRHFQRLTGKADGSWLPAPA